MNKSHSVLLRIASKTPPADQSSTRKCSRAGNPLSSKPFVSGSETTSSARKVGPSFVIASAAGSVNSRRGCCWAMADEKAEAQSTKVVEKRKAQRAKSPSNENFALLKFA